VTRLKSYNENLPTVNEVKVTPEVVEAISKYNGEYSLAAHAAVLGVAADVFKKDKDVSVIEAKVGFMTEADSINMTVHRSKTFTSVHPKGEEGKEFVKDLWTKTDFELAFTTSSSLRKVKDAIGEEFAASK
jgi:hypothetical protein